MNHDDTDPAASRRVPLVLLALLGLSMVAGPLVTDKAPGGWGVAFTVAGLVLVGAAAVLAVNEARPNDTDDTNGETHR